MVNHVECKCCKKKMSIFDCGSWHAPMDLCWRCEELEEGKPVDPTLWPDYNGCTHTGRDVDG